MQQLIGTSSKKFSCCLSCFTLLHVIGSTKFRFCIQHRAPTASVQWWTRPTPSTRRWRWTRSSTSSTPSTNDECRVVNKANTEHQLRASSGEQGRENPGKLQPAVGLEVAPGSRNASSGQEKRKQWLGRWDEHGRQRRNSREQQVREKWRSRQSGAAPVGSGREQRRRQERNECLSSPKEQFYSCTKYKWKYVDFLL